MNVAGLIALAFMVASAVLVAALFLWAIGIGSLNQCLAALDAALFLVYFGVEFGHGGGRPSNRSGL